MKKLLAIVAMGAIASLGAQSVMADDWAVKCYNLGPKREGGPITNLARTNPALTTVAEMSDNVGDVNFMSLGFGGYVTLEYIGGSGYFGNGLGADFTVYETTWGDPTCDPIESERALVEFSEDGINWLSGNACHNNSFDISPLMKAKYVRITDKTDNNPLFVGDGNDAYDVDGIVSNYDYDPTPQPGLCTYEQGVASQFVGALGNFPGRGIVNQRKSFANAGINEFSPATIPATRESPQVYNFWSLGFGGHACFQLPYTVFDAAGPDFTMFETTWNNKPCPNYPETVNLYVSPDAINWSAATVLCKDGNYDIAGAFAAVNYIKFVDISNPASFSSGSDAYDIDNIAILQLPPGDAQPNLCLNGPAAPVNRQAFNPAIENNVSEGGIPEEMFALEIVGSNLVSDEVKFSATIAEKGGYTYTIRNHTGQEISKAAFEGNLYDTPEVAVKVSNLASGVYFLTLESATGKETVKFIKK